MNFVMILVFLATAQNTEIKALDFHLVGLKPTVMAPMTNPKTVKPSAQEDDFGTLRVRVKDTDVLEKCAGDQPHKQNPRTCPHHYSTYMDSSILIYDCGPSTVKIGGYSDDPAGYAAWEKGGKQPIERITRSDGTTWLRLRKASVQKEPVKQDEPAPQQWFQNPDGSYYRVVRRYIMPAPSTQSYTTPYSTGGSWMGGGYSTSSGASCSPGGT